ncbi:MAG: YeiH family protein [Thermodesulfovibrionales bacterium]
MLKDYSGLLLSFLIAFLSTLISRLHLSLDPLVLSIIFGMLFSNMLAKREFLGKGINVMLRLFLPIGIALYGSQLTLSNSLDFTKWIIILAVFLATFLFTVLVSSALGLSRRLSILLASGLSICGASAIAIISPLIRARKEETSISLIVIMIIGLTTLVFYPLLYDLLGLKLNDFTLLSGTTIPMMGQVKVTALRVAGAEGLAEALRYKLIRVSMLFFLVIGIILLFREREKGFHLPWFMLIFMILAIVVNLTERAADVRQILQPWSSFFLSSGLAAIGLSVEFESITIEGSRPLFAVFISWGLILSGTILLLRLLNV